jgi:hypothetical protein
MQPMRGYDIPVETYRARGRKRGECRSMKQLAAVRLKWALRLARLNRAIAPIPPLVFEKLFFFGGLISLGFGLWRIYNPLGLIAAGLIGVWLATLISGERDSR